MKTLTAALPTAMATATVAALLTAAPAQSADLQPPSSPGSVNLAYGDDPDSVYVGWFAPHDNGSLPIRRYVVKWDGGKVSVATRPGGGQATVTDLAPGRYVFRVKAVSRAGSSPWAKSSATYVE